MRALDKIYVNEHYKCQSIGQIYKKPKFGLYLDLTVLTTW